MSLPMPNVVDIMSELETTKSCEYSLWCLRSTQPTLQSHRKERGGPLAEVKHLVDKADSALLNDRDPRILQNCALKDA
ncbi:uncharacterized protein N7473_006198 [Penicillium subrubescens]|uniref:uncharacterized protein n=1 Tax=Penicillium subrubescens TaxID=1316194 RepID=UPI00254547E9|nr:uncharacterized protein N7473_006198 [Penicillium subrubescens]KAJ5896799.1 hypothetical protein N7473_006198 [Penicillium subrubescens]